MLIPSTGKLILTLLRKQTNDGETRQVAGKKF